MTLTLADTLSRSIEAAAEDVLRIRALSRTQPHCFAEDKDVIARRLRTLAAELRNAFGGPATQFRPGTIAAGRHVIRVERRRAA